MKSRKLKIDGMTCINCQEKITAKLSNTAGIKKANVRYRTGDAVIVYDEDLLSLKDICGVIQRLGYAVVTDKSSSGMRTAGFVVIIFSLYVLLMYSGLLNYLVPSQLAEVNMSYGMLFMIGLLTSVHCMAMCGGITLSQCIPVKEKTETQGLFSTIKPTLLYNLGRVSAYTAVGFLVGALGSVITISNMLQGLLKLAAGLLMLIMGFNMLGIFPGLRRLNVHMPRSFGRFVNKRRADGTNPFVVGILNGLMPCGPLQAMQIYALSTGSPLTGALSMLLFSLGTVPLMFGLGALGSALGKRFSKKAMTAGAVLVAVMGLSMFSQGWSLSGFYQPAFLSFGSLQENAPQDVGVITSEGTQLVRSNLSPGRYPSITVKAGVPVTWVIQAEEGSINGCNNRIFIPQYGLEYTFSYGENIVSFMPEKTGDYQYSCWMGMIRATIHVVEQESTVNVTE